MTTTIAPPSRPHEDPDDAPRAGTVTAELPKVSPPPREIPRRINVRTRDDYASVLYSAVTALGLVWLVYYHLLPFSGRLGFVLTWWLCFLALYATVSAISNPAPVVIDRVVSAVLQSVAAVVGIALVSTIVFIFVKGWPAIHHWNFYSQDMSGIRPTDPLTKGGIRHAMTGTAIEVGIATLISLPLGVATAVYMIEVRGKLAQVVRTVVEAMTALPDILAGLFIYTVFIIGFQWERTGFTVSLALSVTMIPIIARATDVALRVVPGGLREASLALGASQWQTVRRVVLPTARSGIVTALILGVARVTGESAPLLIVSAASSFQNNNPFHQPMNSLPLYIFLAITSGEDNYVARGYGAASVLLFIVLVLFVLARFFARSRVRPR
ncbi:MAG TPA: phosphate ABC transporter permease PstA [Jatrophihabitantaceae bacterium]|nr:phosphate ABC transporter permease PstA [Jatrophihabitantaceae bacterium]